MQQQPNLTPAQRAALKAAKSLAYILVLNILTALTQYLSTHGTINWSELLYFVGAQVLLAIALVADKYFSAQGDAPLALAVEGIEAQAEKRAPAGVAPVVPDAEVANLPAPSLFVEDTKNP